MKRNIVIIVILVLANIAVKAQVNRHEFVLSAGGGISTLNFKPNIGNQNNGFGGAFGLGYTYFFTQNIGIGTGLELGLYNSSFKGDFKHTINNITDPVNNLVFDFRSQITNYKETQRVLYLNIPIMLQYQLPIVKENQFYIAAGVKVGIPLSGRYETSQTDFYNTGYFHQSGNELPVPKFKGFGNFSKTHNGNFTLNTSFMLALEGGIKWGLSNNKSLYTGLYLDYGLNNIISDDNSKDFIAYDPAKGDEFYVNSIAASSYTDKANLLSTGIKLRFSFGKGKTGDKPAFGTESQHKAEEQARLQAEKEAADKAKALAEANAKKKAEEARLKAERDAADKAKQQAEAEQQRAKNEYQKVLQVIAIPVTDFNVNSTALSADMKKLLDEKADLLKANPAIQIICEGHTCDIGSEEVNQHIGMERAQVAKNYLIQKGIEDNRIKTISKGKANPVVPNDNEENRRKNRRVVFIITE